jgi:DNA-binding MurR/RpiR family transcriptional regulator
MGAAFAQVKTRYDAVQKKLQENTAHQALFKPIIAALTELSTHVDSKAIQKIAQLLSELRQ